MTKRCQYFKQNHCNIWIDYQVMKCALDEADELSHRNWMEIQFLLDRVHQLESFIHAAGLPIPDVPE